MGDRNERDRWTGQKRGVARALTLVIMALSLGACTAPNTVSFYIESNVAQPPGKCEELTADSTRLLSGTLDMENRSVYAVRPVYVNQLRSNASDLRVDPNSIQVESMVVEVLADDQRIEFPGMPNPFRVPASAFVPSASGTTSGRSVGVVSVLTPPYVQYLSESNRYGQVVLVLRAVGRTTGQTHVESDEWQWPLILCKGCLFRCAGADESALAACEPGQDFESIVSCAPPAS